MLQMFGVGKIFLDVLKEFSYAQQACIDKIVLQNNKVILCNILLTNSFFT